jgi:hypothetical protein
MNRRLESMEYVFIAAQKILSRADRRGRPMLAQIIQQRLHGGLFTGLSTIVRGPLLGVRLALFGDGNLARFDFGSIVE